MRVSLLVFYFLVSLSIFAQSTFTSVQNGDWNDASTWTLGAGAGGVEGVDYPSASDIVTINNDVTINTTNSGANFSFTGKLTINASHTLESQVGNNIAGFVLEGNGLMINNGNFYTLDASETPDQNAKIPYEFVCKDNSVFVGGLNSFAFISDDWNIQGNAQIFIDNLNCYAVSDDVILNGTNCFMYGNGNIRIGGDGPNSQVEFNGGASVAQLDDDITIWNNTASLACGAPGTAVIIGTNAGNIPPFAFNDVFTSGINVVQNQTVLTQGTKVDFSPISGDVVTLTSVGSDAGATNGLTTQGGTVSVNNNGTPGNPADDYVVYTPALGFSGVDTYNYLITNVGGGTDIAAVSISISTCGPGFVEDTLIGTVPGTSPAISQTNSGVSNPGNAIGSPNGTEANVSTTAQLTLKFSDTVKAGSTYNITWSRQNAGGSGPVTMSLGESSNGAIFTTNPVAPSTSSKTLISTTVTANVDFIFLRVTSASTGLEIDGIVANTTVPDTTYNCILDSDNDGIIDDLDIDDDNDGILDADEAPCETPTIRFDAAPDAYWTLDNTTDDATANNNDERSDGNTPGFSTVAIQGTHSADFNGTSNQIRYSQDGGFMEAAYTDVSFSAWIRPTDLTGDRIIYEEGGGTNGLILWLDDGLLTYTARSGGAGSETSVSIDASRTLVIDNLWHHVAGTFQDGVMTVYLDGISETVTAGFISIPAHTSDGGIGGPHGASPNGIIGNYSGLMDAARYSNTQAWSATRIGFEAQRFCDTDNDGVEDHFDLDSDGDGVADIVEAGGIDADGNGFVDGVFSDLNNDGWSNVFDNQNGSGGIPLIDNDSDGDGFENRIDIDSDGDGIIDIIESQVSGVLISPSGTDSDSDGIDDGFDLDNGNFLTIPVNTDGLGNPDYIDLDSDNDEDLDILEGWDTNNDGIADILPAGADFDNDGLDDNFDNVVGPNNTTNITDNGKSSSSFPNLDITATAEPDWREAIDSDKDGVPDFADVDDDNDGLLDSDENFTLCLNPLVSFVNTPQAFWSLDNNTNDISGNNNNQGSGTVAPTYSTSAVQGSHSAIFNGSQGIRYSVDGGFMEFDYSQISFSAWIIPDDLSGTRVIYEEGGTTHGSVLWMNGNVLTYTTRVSSTQVDVAHQTILVLDNSWHHVAATYNNGIMTVYLDGVASSSTPVNGSNIPPHASDGGIGSNFGGVTSANIVGNFSGLMDAARYSNSIAWSAASIAAEAQQNCDVDSDGDGILNKLDLDSDNDGIPDIIEAGGLDIDGNGLVDDINPDGTLTADTDNDGLADVYDANNGGANIPNADSDGDGIKNALDLDSDNDGIPDIVEAGGVDIDGNGVVDNVNADRTLTADTDNDGLADVYDSNNGGVSIPNVDFDGDGVKNALDLDSDGDGILDVIEAGGTDSNNDGIEEGFVDNDGDGFNDLVDGDVGNDGISENTANSTTLTGVDGNNDGIPDTYPNDDFDSDGKLNYLDIDSDNDGITDNTEGQSTVGYISPANADADGDGIDDAYDSDDANFGGAGSSFVLSDIDISDDPNSPDYLDLDSDEDGFSDAIEGHDTDNDKLADAGSPSNSGVNGGTVDADNDGLLDGFDNNTASTDATNSNLQGNSHPNITNPISAERDWREVADRDNDGISDAEDIDDDNDGILDIDECVRLIDNVGFENSSAPNVNANNLGVSIAPWIMAGGGGTNVIRVDGPGGGTYGIGGPEFDARGGAGNYFDINGVNGIIYQTFTISSTETVRYSIFYSARDGGSGVVEALIQSGTGIGGAIQSTTTSLSTSDNTNWQFVENTVTLTPGTYSFVLDIDDFINVDEASVSFVCDDDGDGIANEFDLDSDNDGIPDLVEAGGVDSDGDGRVDGFLDTDGDGWANAFDFNNGGTSLQDGDQDGDGIRNRLDLDSDDDGLQDIIEAGGVDANGDGAVDDITDIDNDGLANLFDADNGGTALSIPNSDGDGTLPNYLDLDSDNDGIIDNVEWQTTAGFNSPSNIDANNNGWDDEYDGSVEAISNNDAAGDGADYVDLNSDNDAQPDWLERADDNADGDALLDLIALADAYEAANGNPNHYVSSDDADADDIPDFLEDAGGLPAFLTVGNAFYRDTDNDGLVDFYDADQNGDNRTNVNQLSDVDIDGSPDFRDTDNAITLPIELLSFTAIKVGAYVQLDWSTATEINNDYFTIERSLDGEKFEEILTEQGAGNSSSKLVYRRYDEAPLMGYNYYRLSQTDFNGESESFNVEVVNFDGGMRLDNNSTINMKVYPNPTNGSQLKLLIERLDEGELILDIVTAEGQLIDQRQLIVETEKSNWQVEVLQGKSLAAGTYYLRVISKGEIEILPFIVK